MERSGSEREAQEVGCREGLMVRVGRVLAILVVEVVVVPLVC